LYVVTQSLFCCDASMENAFVFEKLAITTSGAIIQFRLHVLTGEGMNGNHHRGD